MRSGQWSVSTRSIGEVLTVQIRCDGLQLLLFAKPAEETAKRIESRLGDLLSADRTPDSGRSGSASVPQPLARAVSVLLELVNEVEQATKRRAGAIALYQSTREIACACIGGGEPDVWSHDQPFDAPWVALRDASSADESAIPRARAFSMLARADLDMRLQWPYLLGTPRPEGVVVEARWRAPAGFEVTVRSLSDPVPRADYEDDATDALGAEAATRDDESDRGDFFAGWFDDLERDAPARDDDESPPRALPAYLGHVEQPETLRAALAFPDLVNELREQVEGADLEIGDDVEYEYEYEDEDEYEDEFEPSLAANAPEDAGAADELDWADGPNLEELSATQSSHAAAEWAAEPWAEGAEATEADGAAPDESNEPAAVSERAVRRPHWPAIVRRRAAHFEWRPHAWWIGLVVALFVFGMWVGTRGGARLDMPSSRSAMPVQLMRALGLASPRFTLEIRSTPSGATIAIDGKLTTYRTPAEIELPPGDRTVTLTLSDLGQVVTNVHGRRGQRMPLDIPLTGSLLVSPPNAATPVSITLDGESRGYAPLEVRDLVPGTHDLKFETPGEPPWTQTISMPVRGELRIVARPFDLPSTGVIHVRATYLNDDGSTDLRGADVTVDGERRGTTPLTLELTRGPHSLHAEYRGDELPVQVIDLPGGNERFAEFSFGSGAVFPQLVLQTPPGPMSREASTPISVALHGLTARDVREIWLDVGAPDGSWRRYPMTLLPGQAGPVAVVVFPAAMLNEQGRAPFYVSLLVSTGEEYFTDITGRAPRTAPTAPRRAPRTRTTPPTQQVQPAEVHPARLDEPYSEPPPITPSTP